MLIRQLCKPIINTILFSVALSNSTYMHSPLPPPYDHMLAKIQQIQNHFIKVIFISINNTYLKSSYSRYLNNKHRFITSKLPNRIVIFMVHTYKKKFILCRVVSPCYSWDYPTMLFNPCTVGTAGGVAMLSIHSWCGHW